MHEISHGLGPLVSNEALGPILSSLEEAKADVVGMFGLQWLLDKGILDKNRSREFYASYLAGLMRSVRFGTGESHSRAQTMELNYLSERGAIQRTPDGLYAVRHDTIPQAMRDLARELLEQEALGDRSRAEAWFTKYGTMPADLKTALAAVTDIPVDIDPQFAYEDGVQ
jgi:hypothetical protein